MVRTSLAAALLTLVGSARASAAIPELQTLGDPVEVPPSVLQMVAAAFPEARAVSQAYLRPTFDPNLVISERTSVDVTFLAECTLNLSALGYFTYAYEGTGVRILERGMVFPNASSADRRGKLRPGDTSTLRDAQGAVRYFEPGTHVGFFLAVNAWNGSEVRGWDPANPQLPSADPSLNQAVVTSVEALNPESAAGHSGVARHVAMIGSSDLSGFLQGKPFLLMGMEDLRRDQGSDDDFNDVVFAVHSEPSAVLSATRAPIYASPVGDPDGDGVSGLADAFPADPTRATVRPSTGSSIPSVTVATEEILDGHGQLKEIEGTFHRSAGHGSATLILSGLPAEAQGTLRLERFTASGAHTLDNPIDLREAMERQPDGSSALRLPKAFLGEGEGVESLRLVLTFDQPIRPDLPAGQARQAYPWSLDGEADGSPAPGAWLRDWKVGVGP